MATQWHDRYSLMLRSAARSGPTSTRAPPCTLEGCHGHPGAHAVNSDTEPVAHAYQSAAYTREGCHGQQGARRNTPRDYLIFLTHLQATREQEEHCNAIAVRACGGLNTVAVQACGGVNTTDHTFPKSLRYTIRYALLPLMLWT